ncbi:MAG TPA: DUF4124 domain-containing protein [Pseudomonadales bacterium]|nr:DUF4124 domain-containing protein [Pseudomonadales bacterium]
MMKHVMIVTGLATALVAGNVAATEYYKWVDDKGVTRYAEQPPVGIKAEKVNTYSGGSSKYDPNAANAIAEEERKEQEHKEQVGARAKQLEEEEKQKCAKIAEQRKVLTERGRVRMRDKDGNERVLTQEEQAAKIIELEKYEKEMCNKK